MLTTERRCSYSKTLLLLWLISNMVFLIESRHSGSGRKGPPKRGPVYVVLGIQGRANAINALKKAGVTDPEKSLLYAYKNMPSFAAVMSESQAQSMKGVDGVVEVHKSRVAGGGK
ncbi:unnamed protein product [Bemisia tabaci]|uniref:Inhibitor I9 domain-containing protein n=1 Tax=Bemisia tabaci TaxID=7038 RepID=A0A9P0G201_BEMTA|nr:unnamed protein product [Bemisia tabaci]